jgi:exopolysaccharide production protein ExoQ
LSTVALLLCTAFVLWLLSAERRSSQGVSAAIWIPTVWLMIAATNRSLEVWLNGPTPNDMKVFGTNETGNPIDRWTLIVMVLVAVVIIARRHFNWSAALRRHGWLIVLLAYLLLSTFWSDITAIALRRWAREWVTVVMTLLIMSETNPRQALASLLRRCAYVLIPFSVVLIKYFPILGRQYSGSGVEMWTGVTGQKNELGRLCMISLLFLLFALYQRWREPKLEGDHYPAWGDVSIIALSLYLLIASNSATSLATVVVGIAIFFSLQLFQIFRSSAGQIALQALVVLLIAFGTLTPFRGGSNVAGFASILGRDDTLTGRTDVWASVMPAREQRPLLGYGFGSFWTDARRELYEIPTAHNGYLDILLETGEVGLLFYALWLLSCARQLHRSLVLDYGWASFGICLLLMSLIYNITESALNSTTDYMTSVAFLGCLVVPAGLGPRLGLKPASALPPFDAEPVALGVGSLARRQ